MNKGKALAGLRILIIEDDYFLASDEQRLLQAAGAQVIGPFADAEQAAGAALEGEIDCALVDINLGAGLCFSAARTLREKAIPFLFTTGYDAASIPDEFSDIERIEKPVNEQALLAALSRIT